MMLLPLAICGVCIITSIIGTFFVRLGKNNNIMGALYQGLIVTGVLSVGRDLVRDPQARPGATSASTRRRPDRQRRRRCSAAASSAWRSPR